MSLCTATCSHGPGKAGAAKNYVTRNQALKKLQLTLADFRRLCILKGVYPREPRHKKKANKGSTAPATFYYAKDIQYLLHEPIINTFRAHKSFAKRLSHAIGKQDVHAAKSLSERKPRMVLDHIIKERYPSFYDALNDLDDALSMVFLFANMPTTQMIGANVIANCERLAAEFQHYVIRSRSLRKVFLSVKGIYYQAEIQGQEVTWLVPYKFSQRVPSDVDFRIMITFLELYQTFMGFVNYKLYSDLGLVYPPKLNIEKDENAAGLGAYEVETAALDNAAQDGSAGKASKKLIRETKRRATSLPEGISERDAAIDDTAEGDAMAEEPLEDGDENLDNFAGDGAEEEKLVNNINTKLFEGQTFYLSRETPRYTLEFTIRAFGGAVTWDPVLGGAPPLPEDSEMITFHVADRPSLQRYIAGRSYVQPQYIYDCVNQQELLPVDKYAIGALLPPHLSPFVTKEPGQYDPSAPIEADDESADAEMAESEAEDEEALDDSAEAAEARQAQKELDAEARGVSFSEAPSVGKPSKKTGKKLSAAEREDAEAKELAKGMMSNKQKKLYGRMMHSNQARDTKAANLRRKRLELNHKNKTKTKD